MAKKQQPPIDTDPFGSYTGIVRFPDRANPSGDAKPHRFPDAVNSGKATENLSFAKNQNPLSRKHSLRFPDAMNPVQDADDL